MSYLAQLTGDALPTLAAGVEASSPPDLLAHLACQSAMLEAQISGSKWQSFHFGRRRAERSLASITDLLEPYQVIQEHMAWYVTGAHGTEIECPGQQAD